MRPLGSSGELERRRIEAIKLLKSGQPPVAVARLVGVDRRSVRRWNAAYREKGRKGLKATPNPGPIPKLDMVSRKELVKTLLKGAQAHGGDLTVESAEGRGAAFFIRFPPERPVVLVADDQEVQRALIKKHILEIKEVEIVEASNGFEALEILKTTSVVLLITDLGMPEMDGFELLMEIRGNPLMQTLPVIVNSAISSSTGVSGELIDIRRKVFELGANDFIAKPIVPEDFIPRVIRYLG